MAKKKVARRPQPASTASAETSATAGVACRGDRLFGDVIVPDEATAQMRFGRYSRGAGFRIHLAAKAQRALAAIGDGEPAPDSCACQRIGLIEDGMVVEGSDGSLSLTRAGELVLVLLSEADSRALRSNPTCEHDTWEFRWSEFVRSTSFDICAGTNEIRLFKHMSWRRPYRLCRRERCAAAKMVNKGYLTTDSDQVVLTTSGQAVRELMQIAGYF